MTTLCGALLVAGCGGNDAAPAGGGSGSGSAPSGDVVTIAIKNIEFVPKQQKVRVGQTVEWVNEDSVPHNVIDEGDAFKSDTLQKGAKFRFTAAKAGTYDYVCTFHSGQTGTLVVEG